MTSPGPQEIDPEEVIKEIKVMMAMLLMEPAHITDPLPPLSVDDMDLRLMARAAFYTVIGAYGIEP